MKNKKIIIAGGSGFIGQGLVEYFGKTNEIIVLGRGSNDKHKNLYSDKRLTAAAGYNIFYQNWQPENVNAEWINVFDKAELVINLAGKSVNCRYHEKQKQEIFDSRTITTKAVAHAIRMAANKPSMWINASSSTIYKDTYDRPNDEFTGKISDWKKDNMPYNFIDAVRHQKNKLVASFKYGKSSKQVAELEKDFSVAVCKRWEKTFFDEATPGVKKIALRTAITLGKGGVITPYLNLCKFALGGKHGNGKQMYSWVHIHDVCRMIEWLFENNKEGIYNCVSPHAITNSEFMKTLRNVTGHKIGLPAPVAMLEAGAWLIGTETELMLKSRWVVPAKVLQEGFVFKYDTIDKAFTEIINNISRKAYQLF